MYERKKVINFIADSGPKDQGIFLIVETEDKSIYQVKFTKHGLFYGNLNEMLGHFIGSLVQAPILPGAFLDFGGTLPKIENIVAKQYNIRLDMRIFNLLVPLVFNGLSILVEL